MSRPVNPVKGGTRRLRVAAGSGGSGSSVPVIGAQTASDMGWLSTLSPVHGAGYIIPTATGVTAASAWPEANTAIAMPIVIGSANFSVASIRFNVGTQSGNFDVGIYTSAWAKVVTLGATAVPAAGFNNANIADQTLTANTLYYVAFVCDNITATFAAVAPSVSAVNNGNLANAAGSVQMGSAYPLPDTFVPAARAVNTMPSLALRSV